MSRGWGACVIAGIMILSLAAVAKPYYKYRDRRGVTHFVEDPKEAPAAYRKQVTEVTAEVGREEVRGESTFQHWQRMARDWWRELGEERDPEEELANQKLGGLIWFTARETWIFWTLAGEAAALLGLVFGLWHAQDYPTRQERRRYTILLVVVYALLLGTSVYFLVRPQLKNFCAQTVVNADLVLAHGGLVEAEQARLTRFRESALTWADRIP